MPNVIFHQQNRTIKVKEGTELARLPLLDATVPLRFGCHEGHCGTCAIAIKSGEENLSPKTKQETQTLCRLKLGCHYRLSCQCAIKGDVVIDK